MGGGGGKRGPQSAHAQSESLVQVAIGAAAGMRGPQSAQSEP
ncbi:hypothetical protein Ctob_002688, partial [Chrysochromulina tobinii]